jgi:hypothetical protein
MTQIVHLDITIKGCIAEDRYLGVSASRLFVSLDWSHKLPMSSSLLGENSNGSEIARAGAVASGISLKKATAKAR